MNESDCRLTLYRIDRDYRPQVAGEDEMGRCNAGAVGMIIEVYGPDYYQVDFGDDSGSVWSSDLTKISASNESR